MAETPKGAILQRDKTTYAIVPRTPVGLVSPEILENISKVVRKYEIPIIKITSGQRMALVGLKADQVDAVWKDLQMDVGKATELCVHYAQACPGTAVCKFGVQDSLGLGLELEKMYEGIDLPAKVKFGVSGCPLCCGESYVRDIGVVGKKGGWTLIMGGNSGGRPRIGDVIAEDLTKEQVIDLVKRCLEYFKENGKKKERTSTFVERVGIDAVKKAVL
ncbi:NAD(P)/FAD-dependent oxidoreductase [Desulforhabdus amnigena]|jgi:NAD(P)H-nitrite reductase large subunit|uniref:Sulfite reductase, assimilatory-type n=1 Tax=Desulforhabdus amnigena TaxID=40218 RepID=A0A9W6FTC4_9BACT|nr:NAD(P)/FAD-dependent oxidoreductase [Desulforhabdus amnigena]NLJ27256.1 NAD(P)/FAD-dependent oxidoreductase [Deltaproteobacteria bacterium]GLI32901.1 sulfite reductase, assimilatory-type [Desulforhabdus amnigena]